MRGGSGHFFTDHPLPMHFLLSVAQVRSVRMTASLALMQT